MIAIISERNNKIDLVIKTTAGSVLQISFLISPILIITGWIMSLPVSMLFSPFIVFSLVISSLLFKIFIIDSESNLIERMIYDDETIINTVMSYIESNPKNYDDNSILRNPNIKNTYNFDLIYKEVEEKNLNYSSIIAKYNTDLKIKRYEKSESFKFIVNREAMR
ncbi:11314_t:CDS:2 [Scutellospora calospora]|uniref:11314_t:CDS:1 n=1 Tax=Scutellospora calospora TaxID=85575 RepID=A0ACA9JZL9_9GLOM|nr:11314_t:CDS:2 [Scutellospora calospora]